MKQIKFPAGYQQVMPYLILKNAAGFLQFMKDVFDATEKEKHMRDDNTILHAEINIGESIIMFAERTETYPPECGAFFIYVADADATYARALAAGATAKTPVSDQPYGRSGGVTDPYGNTWWITTDKQPQP